MHPGAAEFHIPGQANEAPVCVEPPGLTTATTVMSHQIETDGEKGPISPRETA